MLKASQWKGMQMSKTSTRKKCEGYAKENSLKLDQYFYREYRRQHFSHKIELPDGLYTQGGNTGFFNEDEMSLSAPEYWHSLLEEMQALVSDGPWLTFDEARAKGLSV